jgi:prepilin-type N-terminal cleavage/methylation domain-containing protein
MADLGRADSGELPGRDLVMNLHRIPPRRRGFNLIEVLIALAITATLLTATLAALDASFRAYQATTEEVSTQSIGRIVMHRMLTLIRTGTDFGPFPEDPRVTTIQSDFIQFRTQNEEVVTISWDRNRKQLLYELEGQAAVELLDGVVGTIDAQGVLQSPFTLSYENGRQLYRATIDLTVEPNEVIQLDIEGDRARTIRLVGSAMPRIEAF